MWQPQGIYNEFVLRTPVLLTGNEAVRGLYNFPAVRVAVIHGRSLPEEEQALFRSTFSKKDIQFFSRSWTGEPDLESLRGTLNDLEAFSPDTIIAIGGGSVIDGAKLCRLLYEVPSFDPSNSSKLNGNLLKTHFIAIPTTIGSGAEVSSAAVYIDKHNSINASTKSNFIEDNVDENAPRKEMVVLHELEPEVIVYDERYLLNTPTRLLMASAMDAAAHLIEGYVSKMHNSVIEMKAEEGLRLLHDELGKFLTNGAEINYQRLQYAGHLGGIVQNHCIVGAAHAVAHQMTDYSHSEAVALLLPAVIKMNSRDEATSIKYNVLACNSGFKGISDLVAFLEYIADQAVKTEHREEMVKLLLDKVSDTNFLNNVKLDRSGKGNPVDITDDYILKLIGGL